VKWKREDYHTASDTHAINWSWNGKEWCVLLWCKSERKYTKRRFCPTEQDKERAIAAFKAVAGEPKSLRQEA
jgi:hypothetical protein